MKNRPFCGILSKKEGNRMKKTNAKITRYEAGAYYIDIVEGASTYEAWLKHRYEGVSQLMFGVSKESTTYDDFVKLAEDNLPKYKKIYKYEQ